MTLGAGSDKSTVTLSHSAGHLPDRNGDGLADFPSTAAVTQLQSDCKNASEAGHQLLSVTRTLSYPQRKNCSWNSAPNLDRKNGFHQGREVSSGLLELPPGVICDLNIRSKPNFQLHYDDFLILTLANQTIFISNRLIANRLEAQSGIYNWNFASLVGQAIGNFEASTYCLGQAGRCLLPGHDEQGPVQIELTSAELGPIALALMDAKLPNVAMDLIATGDNDDEDCFHSALDLEVEFKYLPR